jgi:putative ABC transport system permease protein
MHHRGTSIKPLHFIFSSLRYHRQIHVAVALGVAVATAVLTGALLVGDSVRGSLRDLALDRLGRIDFVVLSNRLFRADLADETSRQSAFRDAPSLAGAVPALLLEGAIESGARGNDVQRANDVAVVGITPDFWSFGHGGPEEPLEGDSVALSEVLASDLGVTRGDEVLLRLPLAGQEIPAETLLGEKSETMISRRFRVAAVLPPGGLARFGLRPSQQLPQNAFVPLGALQDMLEAPGSANAILVGGTERKVAPPADVEEALRRSVRPTLADFGLVADRKSNARGEYVEITSEGMLISPPVLEQVRHLAGEAAQPIVTYLANTISIGERSSQKTIPYSTITGVTSTRELGPLLTEAGEPILLADDEIALNRWAADDLEARIGDEVVVTFYEPESTHGRPREVEPVTFRLAAIVPLVDEDGEPTAAADPSLTPRLEGVTDQESINNWDLPFDLVETVRQKDEEYWDEYSTTPKAFVSLATARRLWESRYGAVTSIRVPETDAESLEERLASSLDPTAMGITIEPVKAQALAAATGTTPFEGLFVGFSFFLIAAAILLVVLLFRLGVEQRASELGVLLTAGVSRRRVGGMLAAEAGLVAVVGAAVGAGGGVLYAAIMTYGLRNWWVDAVSTPFIELHVSGRSLGIGFAVGIVVTLLTVVLSLRRVVRVPARQLLAGVTVQRIAAGKRASRWPIWTAVLLGAGAIIAAVAGFFLSGQAQAGSFFGAGAMALTSVLLALWHVWRRTDRVSAGGLSLIRLAGRTLQRNPSRSILAMSLIASASFLIVALSAFRLDTSEQGTGGFDLVGESSLPIHFNLADSEGRFDLGFSDADDELLATTQIFTFRVKEGDDASCLNLYQTRQPRVLGVSDDFVSHMAQARTFSWADRGGANAEASPWELLRERSKADKDEGEAAIPVLLDANTATYSLHLDGVGDEFSIEDENGRSRTLRVAALLQNSILQGVVLMSEDGARALFPNTATPRFFLIDRTAASPEAEDIARTLESTLADYGFAAEDAQRRLAGFLVVQNTYLTTFQMLGALGMLLGTVGLAVVELRSVLERRHELALMRATGFRRGRLGWLVLTENATLLFTGLAIGVAAAVVALLPHLLQVRAGIPWATLAAMLVVIVVVGLAAGVLAVRAVAAVPLQAALKSE